MNSSHDKHATDRNVPSPGIWSWGWPLAVIAGLLILGLVLWTAGDENERETTATMGELETSPEVAADGEPLEPGAGTVGTEEGVLDYNLEGGAVETEPAGERAPTSDLDSSVGTAGEVPSESLEDAETIFQGDVESYLGQEVVVRGEVNDVLSPSAFLLDSDGMIGGDEVLVVHPAAAGEPEPIAAGQEIVVRGTLQRFDLEELRRQTGASLDESMLEAYEGDFVIMASPLPPH
jgi:hypothetical protein